MIGSKHLSRQFSRSAVVQAVACDGPVSRASLARQVGLSKQTVSEIVQDLEGEGWLRETGRTAGHVGRTAATYELVPDAAYICGVDLGGTKVRAAIIDVGCTVVSELTETTDPRGGEHVAHQIGALCRKAAAMSTIDWTKLKYAAVGVPGVPERDTGRVRMAPNIAGIDSMDFTAAVESQLGFGVLVENDVNLAAIGEHWAGCASDVDDMVFVSLGTGIGAGIIVNGQIVRGAMGNAGELGYLPFGADPIEPESLRVGALERQAGSFGMMQRYTELSGKQATVKQLFDLDRTGIREASQVLNETALLIARLIATVGAVVDPSMVVLGGSIGHRTELMSRIRAALVTCTPYPLDVRQSDLGDHAALIGGAAVGLSHLHQSIFAAGLSGVEIELPKLSAPNWRTVA